MTRFHVPYQSGNESKYIQQLIETGTHFSGDGVFTEKCTKLLETLTKSKVLLTTSCTHALEMAAILIDVQAGDEIIMSPFTFSSTANAFELRGGKIVYCEIRSDNLNIDERLIEDCITPKTKAIVPMHYGGVGCNMNAICEIAKKHNLFVIEDAAQCIDAYQNQQHLGTFGDIGCISFHETKNIHCGEGGAILVNNEALRERAEIIREKGTNRSQFLRGEIPFYQKVDIGSSYLMSELNAAFLWGQLQDLEKVTTARLQSWNRYYDFFKTTNFPELKFAQGSKGHNGHIFWVISKNRNTNASHAFLGHYQLLENSDQWKVANSTTQLMRLSLEPENVNTVLVDLKQHLPT
ncbi:MAG: dTDP-4-amino-4,6-dideoxygalactose transaminase [Flavobacteriales bacterium]|nr:dTDP-4-amino-4,6-dideoxygalactose transaminase [Flavobacteriales bacterium]